MTEKELRNYCISFGRLIMLRRATRFGTFEDVAFNSLTKQEQEPYIRAWSASGHKPHRVREDWEVKE